MSNDVCLLILLNPNTLGGSLFKLWNGQKIFKSLCKPLNASEHWYIEMDYSLNYKHGQKAFKSWCMPLNASEPLYIKMVYTLNYKHSPWLNG